MDPTGLVGQMMLTDYDDEYYSGSTSSTVCAGGTCTMTISEDQGGYMTQVSTTLGTTFDPSTNVQVTGMSTTYSSQSPSGTVTSYHHSDAAVTREDVVILPIVNASPGSDYGTRVEAALLWGGLAAATVGFFSPFTVEEEQGFLIETIGIAPTYLLDAGMVGGARGLITYLASDPQNPTPDDVLNAWWRGFWTGVVSAGANNLPGD